MATVKRSKVVSISREPSADLIEKAFRSILNVHIGEDFCADLTIARAMFRAHPELVTAAKFPEPYRSHAIAVEGDDPQEDEDEGLQHYVERWRRPTMPDSRTEYRPDAMELARIWAREKRA